MLQHGEHEGIYSLRNSYQLIVLIPSMGGFLTGLGAQQAIFKLYYAVNFENVNSKVSWKIWKGKRTQNGVR